MTRVKLYREVKIAGRIKSIAIIIVAVILLSTLSFKLILKFKPSLRYSLFGGEVTISPEDIQFWVEKREQESYYRVCARYLKNLETEMQGFGHWLHLSISGHKGIGGGSPDIIFNPKDSKIYGVAREGMEKDNREWKRGVYCLREGHIYRKLLKPVFFEGTKFSFRMGGKLEITDAPAFYITIHLPDTAKKLENKEPEEEILHELVEKKNM